MISQDIPQIQFTDPAPAQEPVPSVRASDADRERAIDALIDAFAEGRLTTEELRARTEQAYQARTQAELAAVSADPAGRAAGQPCPGTARRPGHRSHRRRSAADAPAGRSGP